MEAIFLENMYKAMRQTIPKSDMDLESHATQIYRGMLDLEYAQRAAKRARSAGGLGLADQIIAYFYSRGYYKQRGHGVPKKGETMRVGQTENTPKGQSSEVSGSTQGSRVRASQLKKTEKSIPPPKPAAMQSADVNASLSTRAKEFAQAQAIASQAPDLREEKVAQLKEKIALGTYQVSPDAIADRMVDTHLSDIKAP